MFQKYRKFYFLKIVCIISIVIIFVVAYFFVIQKASSDNIGLIHQSSPKDTNGNEKRIKGVHQFNRQTEPLKLGQLKIGGEMPGGPGWSTFAPYMEIPISKFYVSVAEPDTWCINENCNLNGELIQTMGGWLEVVYTGVTIDELFGLDMEENRTVKSIVLIGDQDGKLAGIYPNGDLDDVISILKLHPDLANFNLLKGVSEFGLFRIGELAPLKPGDQIIHLSDKLAEFATHIPKDKKFYFYSVQKTKYAEAEFYEPSDNKYICALSGCRYPEPDLPHDYLFEIIDDLGGWFLTNDQDSSEMVKLFGLDQEEVLSGKSSLVILTDSKGVIAAIHPGKTMSDALTILSQHPDLTDVEGWYKR